MSPTPQPLLANLIGYIAGTVIFGIFLFLLVKDRGGRSLRGSTLTLAAASMALLWNAGALTILLFDSFAVRVVTTGAMSLLPALLLDLLLDSRLRPLAWCGYVSSALAITLHSSEALFADARMHHLTLQATAAGFACLTGAAMLFLRRSGAPSRRASAMALLLFALSFTHFHAQDSAHAWPVELAIHHAGVPLALFVLMQDYRFLLLDAFLRFLASILLASLFSWAAAESAFRLGWVDYRRFSSTQAVLMGLATSAALVLFSTARNASQRLLTRLVFRRDDPAGLFDRLRRFPITSESDFLEFAATEAARFFDAERLASPSGEASLLPFSLGRRSGGRPYLSEDLVLLAKLESQVNERLEQHREQNLRQLVSQAELRALQARIHPHFLFNALNALYGSIPKTATAARQAVLNLADIFRYLLDDSHRLIPLERELAIVRAYLDLESLRLGSRLAWSVDADQAALPVLIPALSVQPLVENAVRHGVAPFDHAGSVRVTARVAGNRCQISVADSGPGFAPGPPARAGVGLDNVRQRLTLCLGAGSALSAARRDGFTFFSFSVPVSQSEAAANAGAAIGS